MPGIFITGTDTGVGKTYVTQYLAEEFRRQGSDVGIMKPISCGPAKDNDALLLKKRLKINDPIHLINPIHLKHPLAPLPAARLEKKKIDLKKIFSAFKELEKKHDLVLVEGVGGVAVPINKNYCVIDLIKDLKLPTIIVARAGLGTINHTLLTVSALREQGIEIMGIILNSFRGKELSEKSNAEMIEELSGVPVIGKLMWVAN
ncbi:dethiobiotin synthase [candidate division WOR-1 bacterium RIFOXYA12_FULL_52_29]|uniref:ATP-dependent dethiobiotin synthetase BioD n=1 Tax=candidate division WOR-1 bacterium RIFOXYC12_FULL_54_18 TaxID=1802584 RepID=A0A1F4T868_UNCSA|nr:MAG: dethiobiotin synthase [candidate division WOR-1 bacterium RIFOXYA2_FULL_51_19]OGC18282.1 MAG: dethiobiotin synthase [candidate division WOR-1 bacterium RIFOXYA12_FULL_52_29]OGC27137.1 MAG: dethiobiotin synthase [candidate division WOR-1 bacterium RIFOXYB2_FULL_45_9]OGC28699.1 MAG: dethiobiotin synthase [candidate division WOR-1 bacterium RIFOXYC12_FULL_54_18]